jgi:hypothetical protein
MDVVETIAFVLALGMFVMVVALVRRRRLKERYSLIWLFASALIVVFASSRRLLALMAGYFGVYYPPSLLFLFGVLFLVAINILFTITLSELSNSNNRLAQEVALLKAEMEEIRARRP